MTLRQASDAIRRYLRTEQRVTPHTSTDYDDPLPDVIQAMNAAVQQIAVLGPYEGAKQGRSAYFRAPATVAVSGLTRGATSCTITGAQSYMAGCEIVLPGDANKNRITKLVSTTATLQFPHLSDDASGDATINFDTVELDEDVITVQEPVKVRGATTLLRAVANRHSLSELRHETGYFIETTTAPGGVPKLRMMLSTTPAADTVVEFQARVAPAVIATSDIQGDSPGYTDPGVDVPVPAGFAESIFLPIALDLFFSAAAIANYDVKGLENADAVRQIREQAAAARLLLERMRPQANKPLRFKPWG